MFSFVISRTIIFIIILFLPKYILLYYYRVCNKYNINKNEDGNNYKSNISSVGSKSKQIQQKQCNGWYREHKAYNYSYLIHKSYVNEKLKIHYTDQFAFHAKSVYKFIILCSLIKDKSWKLIYLLRWCSCVSFSRIFVL